MSAVEQSIGVTLGAIGLLSFLKKRLASHGMSERGGTSEAVTWNLPHGAPRKTGSERARPQRRLHSSHPGPTFPAELSPQMIPSGPREKSVHPWKTSAESGAEIPRESGIFL